MTNTDKLRNQIGQLCRIVDTIDGLRREALYDLTADEVEQVSALVLLSCERLDLVVDILALAGYRATERRDMEDAR